MAKTRALLAHSADVISIDFAAPRKRRGIPLPDRIDRLTDKSAGLFSCWGWSGARCSGTGYPHVNYTCPFTGRRVTKTVARAMMEQKLGRKLERHEHVLHNRGCRKDCVQPLHHRVGSRAENVADAIAEGRTKRAKLKPAQVLKIVELRQKHHVDISAIAHRFGISNQSVNNVLKGRTHAKLTGIVRVARKPPLRLVENDAPITLPRFLATPAVDKFEAVA